MLTAPTNIRMGPGAPPAIGQHGYFNTLVARADHWKSYSLRTQTQLVQYKATSDVPWVNYLWPADLDLHAQDAAKVVVPLMEPFARSALAAACTASQTVLTVVTWSNLFVVWRGIKIDNEVMMISAVNATLKQVTVSRGRVGTVAASHLSGQSISLNTNNLLNQVRLPLGTTDGHVYLITWDGYWTDSYLATGLANHKCFMFSRSPVDAIWLEQQTRFAGDYSTGFNAATDVASCTMRTYATLAPPLTKVDPILPMSGQFIIKPNVWTRHWVRLNLTTGNDTMDYWVADNTRPAVQIYTGLTMSLQGIQQFWLEFNTSTDSMVRSTNRDLVAYVRNVVALKNPVTLPVFEKPK